METGKKGEVIRFLEKPSPDALQQKEINTINAGIYVLEPTVLDLIPEGENCSFEYDVFPKLIESKRGFFAHVLTDEYWRDIGSPSSYLEAHQDFLAGRIDRLADELSATSDIATAAHVDEVSIIGDGCVIKPNATIVNSVLGPGVHVEERATISNSVVWAHSRISTSATIDGAIIGRSCYIGRNVQIRPGAVLGDKASLPDYSRT